MAKSVLDWKVRRNVSENPKTTKEALTDAGRRLIEADRLAEAVDLLQKAGDGELLSSIRLKAVEEGNLFLYKRACQASGQQARVDELKALAEKALAEGFGSYWAKAAEMIDEIQKSS